MSRYRVKVLDDSHFMANYLVVPSPLPGVDNVWNFNDLEYWYQPKYTTKQYVRQDMQFKIDDVDPSTEGALRYASMDGYYLIKLVKFFVDEEEEIVIARNYEEGMAMAGLLDAGLIKVLSS